MNKNNISADLLFTIFLLLALIHPMKAQENQEGPFYIPVHSDLQAYFEYNPEDNIIISGHRGEREAHYPENSLEGFKMYWIKRMQFSK